MPIKAKVGRFDGEIKEFAVNDGDKVSVLLSKANLTLGTGEGVNDDCGNAVSVNDEIEEGETYYIVANYKNGNQ